MKLTSRGAVQFELDPDSYAKMMLEVRELVMTHMVGKLSEELLASITRRVLDTVDYQHLAQYTANNLDYSRVVEYARNGIIGSLLNDERFSSRLRRVVGDATVGVTNETVERVTAIIESNSNNNGDV